MEIFVAPPLGAQQRKVQERGAPCGAPLREAEDLHCRVAYFGNGRESGSGGGDGGRAAPEWIQREQLPRFS